MKRPARLSPGDRVSIVAAAGPVPREPFEAGAAILGGRYSIVYDEAIFLRTGYFAGDDQIRAAGLAQAIDDPASRAIFCARGGYGIMRLLNDRLRDRLRASPKLIIGFSDVTALHALAAHIGLQSIHGPVITQLSSVAPEDATALFDLVESPALPPPMTGLQTVRPGRAEGRLVGGNVELISRLCGTPYAFDLKGAVLLLEDVGERPYRLDRALTQLRLAGAFAGLSGVVLGEFIRCKEPDGSGPTANEAVVERFADLGIPVVQGAPVGHGGRNRAVPLGARVMLDAGSGVLEFLDAAVD